MNYKQINKKSMKKLTNGIFSGVAAIVFGASPIKAQGPYLPDENTMALYHFEESNPDSVYDSSTNLNHGRVFGNATRTQEGRFGNAIIFDGIDDFIKINDSGSLDLSNEMTVEAWAKYAPNYEGSARWIVSKRDDQCCTSGNYVVAWGCDQSCFITLSYTSTIPGLEEGVRHIWYPTPNSWHHVAGTYDGSYLRFWLDYQLVSTHVTNARNQRTNNNPLIIGAEGSIEGGVFGSFFKGTIDEVRISNIARDFNQQASLPDEDPRISTWGKIKHTFK